jgi:DNA (cytosine-5)-methyltransferase 1
MSKASTPRTVPQKTGNPCIMTERMVVSLFSGAGGLSAGFAAAGLRPILAAEIDEDAVATYRANVSDAVVQADIALEADRIVAAAERRLGGHSVFAVIGGPPCQGFSTAGARDHADPRNRLVFSYLDIVGKLRPEWFVFENVEGLLTSGEGDAVVGLAERFGGLGYSFRVDKVNLAQWGVPQARKRVLIVGNRRGLPIYLPEATHAFDGKKHKGSRGLATVTLGEAIAGLPATPAPSHRASVSYVTDVPVNAYDEMMRTTPPGPKAHAVVNFDRDAERIRLLKQGQSLRDLPQDLWPESFRSRAFRRVADGMPTERRGGAPAGLRRLAPEHASLTITSFSTRELVHPEADRPLTLRECARLQSFPDSYDFQGAFQAVAQQIGNAVPPMAAKIIAQWMLRLDGTAGGNVGSTGPTLSPGLVGYHLTDASGMSPALQATDARLRAIMMKKEAIAMPAPRRPRVHQQPSFFPVDESVRLGPEDRKVIADARVLGPISMSDREMARLVSVVLRDLEHGALIPEWARDIPDGDYYDVPLAWFTRDEERPFDFGRFYLSCCSAVANFRVIFRCITKLHRHRRKYEAILRTQPLPTMEQVARRGLLEHGIVAVEALASWLTWRKWIYDIDNRSAQETGYLFEPMLTESLGGRSFSAKASPVKRAEDRAKGRQVDCIVEIDGEKLAYEFKDRITIAASGQGRFAEEIAFPRDCAASGYVPVLLVMDPTPNPKLTQISLAFREAGGKVFLGDEVWQHLSELSGAEIATFVKKYVKDPVESIALRERDLLDLGIRYRSGPDGDSIEVAIGETRWVIPRPRRDEAVAVEEDEDEPRDPH